jgi:hypothetical protein
MATSAISCIAPDFRTRTPGDVRRRATHQDMHAAVSLAREEQGQKRATDEAGGASEQGSAE